MAKASSCSGDATSSVLMSRRCTVAPAKTMSLMHVACVKRFVHSHFCRGGMRAHGCSTDSEDTAT